MRRPFWGTQMRIARIYLREGISTRQLKTMNQDEEMKFFDEHLVAVSQILALTICRGYLAGIILAPLVAFLIRWRVPRDYILEAQRRFCLLRPSRDFTTIIAWAEGTNPFRPVASRRGKNGS
ncbi:hypothetical protein [uncultured Alistipes sp.]|uniref:hypothetical protein n=1 Tax=uncultured Alistipes sp. TaxID=538949 RepID=UPI0025FBEAAA|nr:hypothetical protein [uncultured Alistipes sp.]